MMNKKQSGFTLIELLVVIAIIGILASVVLASLNSARNKGADAAIKANLANARAQAELFYDNTSNTYTGVCDASGGIITLVSAAATAAGVTHTNDAATGATGTCNDSAAAWAAEIPLKATAATFYCVDSAGTSKVNTTTAGLAGATDYGC